MRAIKKIDGVWHCFVCGAAVADQSRPYAGRCQCELVSNRPGLGDMVAAGLAAVGITKERVQAVANKVGIKDCGCKKRQAALNRAGEYLGLPPGQQS